LISTIIIETNSVIIFDDPMNVLNTTGCAIVFMGVILYKVSSYINKVEAEQGAEEDAYKAIQLQEDGAEDLNEDYVYDNSDGNTDLTTVSITDELEFEIEELELVKR